MARRNRRRGPASRRQQAPVTPSLQRQPLTPAAPEGNGSGGGPEATAPTGSQPGASLLPRRETPPPPAGSAPESAAISAPPASRVQSQTMLPLKVAGRAERQRRAEETLTPMDETPGVPTDRTPYLGFDLRRVLVVSLVMVGMVILGFFVIH
ncbi:MAG: hypothetical protein ACREN4_06825 [Candidatus Dormibacteria bacterium]